MNPLDSLGPQEQILAVFFWGMEEHHKAEDLAQEVAELKCRLATAQFEKRRADAQA